MIRGARAQEQTDILVLGAGLSGLHAASLLEELGYNVIVLEGRDRTGGKVETVRLGTGPAEVGAQSMFGGYGRMIDAAESRGVELIDYAPRQRNAGEQELVVNGSVIDKGSWPQSPLNPFQGERKGQMPWQVAWAAVAGNNPIRDDADWLGEENLQYDISLDEFLRAQGLSGPEIDLAYNAVPNYGNSAHDVSALMMHFVDAWNKLVNTDPVFYSAKGGNYQIVDAMAASLSSEVRLSHEVASIDMDGSSVEVRCINGSRFTARAAICSFPFSTLRSVSVTPGMLGAQRRAVLNLPFMHLTLIVMEPKSAFWEKDGLNPAMWMNNHVNSVLSLRTNPTSEEITALVSWSRGYSAMYMDRLGPEGAMKLALEEIESVRPAAKGQLKPVAVKSWGQDPFSAGDWAVWGPGQIKDFANLMSLPHDRMFFCGEHTAKENRGMEGALESAERAVFEAVEIL
jgi:monoamine oxidase